MKLKLLVVFLSAVIVIACKNRKESNKNAGGNVSGGGCTYKDDTTIYKITKAYKRNELYNFDLVDVDNANKKTNYLDLPTFNQAKPSIDKIQAEKMPVGSTIVVIVSRIVSGSCSPDGVRIILPS